MISDTVKAELISAFNTFLATFLTVLGASISSAGGLQWTVAFWSALLIAAVRAAVKAAINSFVPVRLGGRA